METKINKKVEWVPPIHAIPSSMIELTEKEKLELEDVIFFQQAVDCGLLPLCKRYQNLKSSYFLKLGFTYYWLQILTYRFFTCKEIRLNQIYGFQNWN